MQRGAARCVWAEGLEVYASVARCLLGDKSLIVVKASVDARAKLELTIAIASVERCSISVVALFLRFEYPVSADPEY